MAKRSPIRVCTVCLRSKIETIGLYGLSGVWSESALSVYILKRTLGLYRLSGV